jgi:hypothetical protein
MPKQDVLFVLTIDTEEEWLWDDEFPQHDCSVKNVAKLPDFQTFCASLGIRPTYFVDYAIANDATGSKILSQFAKENAAEIGAHLHPWCNPPYFGKTTEAESHVINLPIEQVEQKLDTLTDIIYQNIGVHPQSFRSGRWGINGQTLSLLASKGYKVDSSVYPFYKNDFFSCLGAPGYPYFPSFENALSPSSQRSLLELPVSAGFNIKNFKLGENIHDTLSQPPFSWVKSIGVLWHSKLLRKIYLSPELTKSEDMTTLVDQCLAKRHPVVHMYLHSSSLIDGATGLLNVEDAFTRICKRIENLVSHLETKANVRFCTISEAKVLLSNLPTKDSVIKLKEVS